MSLTVGDSLIYRCAFVLFSIMQCRVLAGELNEALATARQAKDVYSRWDLTTLCFEHESF